MISLFQRHYQACAAILITTFLLVACATTQTESVVKVTVDNTFGNYDQSLESELILITMQPDQHASLTTVNPTALKNSQDLPPEYKAFINDINNRYGLVRVADWPLPAIDIFCIIFENQSTATRSELIAQLELEPGIESAQLVQSFEVQRLAYNDPYLELQHGLRTLNARTSHQWSRGKGVSVAVIDTGFDIRHPELESSTTITKNFVDKNEQQFEADVHGTAVAGIIVADTDNGTGIAGVAPDSDLVALKACWQLASDNDRAVCNTLTLAKALNFAVGHGADVINLSLAGPRDPLLERLVSKALSDNIIVVGAQPPDDKPSFPTVVPGTIAVSMPGRNSAAVSAPGQKVLSTSPGNQYDFYTGSSFSTAHIAGLAALVRELSPQLSAADVLNLLNTTADQESGEVNACNAIAQLIKPQLAVC